MNKYFFLLVCFLFANTALADEPLVFRREQITIIPKGEIPAKPTVTNSTDKEEPKPTPPREQQKLVVEMRPESFLYQPGMTIINPVENKNYLLVIAKDIKSALKQTTIYAPMDIAFIAPDGTITQIVPKLVLHDLTAPVASTQPVKAFLMLGDGEAESLGIRPGDQVEHSMFQPKTQIVKQPIAPQQ